MSKPTIEAFDSFEPAMEAWRELEAIEDEAERATAFDAMVAAAYRHGAALNMAAHLEIDDVIDPAETRINLINGLQMLQTKREELPRRKHGNMPL